jgi:hypothetical protein
MRVIRPTDPAKFNGTVVVEWTNVTNGYDTPVWWLKPKAFYLREGYAYVEVSAQNAGLSNQPNGLRNWSPTRYGSLNVNAGGTLPTDVLSYDIFSQAAAAVRNVPAVLGGLQAQRVIASANRNPPAASACTRTASTRATASTTASSCRREARSSATTRPRR